MLKSKKPVFNHLLVIGCGHIGSSIVRAARINHAVTKISVVETNASYRKQIARLKIVDNCYAEIAETVNDCDLIVIATHISSYAAVCQQLRRYLQQPTLITDVGSLKSHPLQIMTSELGPNAIIIPGHPVAGNENSGPHAGDSRMFYKRYVILTPLPTTDRAKLRQLSAFWRRLGAAVEIMQPYHHDRVLAITSHLPHIIAYALVGSAAELESSMKKEALGTEDKVSNREVLKFSAGGFRDATRLAASNPVMWRDVLMHNREPILEMLGRLQEDIFYLQKAIRWSDGKRLAAWFSKSRKIRRGIISGEQAGRFIPYEDDK